MNNGYCILVANGSRARLFTLPAGAMYEPPPKLVEHADLANPEHKLPGRDKYTTTRSGGNLNPQHGTAHGYDDHRDREDREHERRFARDIAEQGLALAEGQRVSKLIVVAEKRMLGLLREALQLPPKLGLELQELGKDLTRLPPHQLHEHLAAAGLLPPRSSTESA